MQKRKLFLLTAAVLAALWMPLGCSKATGDGFSADVVIQQPKETFTLKLYVMGDYYRVENLEQQILAIEMPGDTTLAMNPEEKTFKAIEGPAGAFINPVKGWEYMRSQMVEHPAGKDTAGGYECDKFVYNFENQPDTVMEFWISPELNHFVKILVHYEEGEGSMTLNNVEIGPQDVSLFQIPNGYTREKTPDEIEAERSAITGEATGSAPVARRMATGGKLIVAADPSNSARIKVENLAKDSCLVTVTAYAGGKPVTMDEPETITLGYKGERKEAFFGVQNQADEILVEVASGRLMATVTNEYSSFDDITTTEYFVHDNGMQVSIAAGKKVRFTLTGDSQETSESSGTVEVFSKYWENNGQDRVLVDKIEFNLKNGELLTREYTPEKAVDYLVIDLNDGGGIKLVKTQPRK